MSQLITTSSLWTQDIFLSEGIRMYYDSREAVLAYASGDGIKQRRTISIGVLDVLERYLEYHFNEVELYFLSETLKRTALDPIQNESANTDIADLLISKHPEGFKLLDLPNEVNIEILKTLYRKACKRYHPDVGGSNRQMQLLNEAYSMFYEYVYNFEISGDQQVRTNINGLSPENLEDWNTSVHLILSCIYGDHFAADKAFVNLRNSFGYYDKCNKVYLANMVSKLLGMGGVLDRTCRVLARFAMKDELGTAAIITSKFIDNMIANWKPRDMFDMKPERADFPSEKDFLSELGTKLIITTKEQANNAFRLGKLDADRYDKLIKKFNTKEDYKSALTEKINDFIEREGFLTKLRDINFETSSENYKVVISPGYFDDRLDFLDASQIWQYFEVFSRKDTGSLFEQYYTVRTNEILLGLIYNFDKIDLRKLRNEIEYFTNFFSSEFSNYLLLNEFLNHLESLNVNTRIAKLELLMALDDARSKSEASSLIISITIDDSLGITNASEAKKRIEVTNEYIEFAKMDLNKLEAFRSGTDSTEEYWNDWNRDLKRLEHLENSYVGKLRNEILFNVESPSPELVVNSTQPYIEELLKLGKEFHDKNTAHLQIGYEINRLTIALMKLKRYKDVVYWGELYFSLPHNYRDRASESEIYSIRKRVEKARMKC